MIEVLYEHWSARMTDNNEVKEKLDEIRMMLLQYCPKDIPNNIITRIEALTCLTDYTAFLGGFIYASRLLEEIHSQNL